METEDLLKSEEMEEEEGARGNLLQDLELGRQEEVVAEEYLVDNEVPEVQQGLDRTEQLEVEQGPEGGLVSVEQFVLEGDESMQVVQIVGETEVSMTRENVLWKLELWREGVVTERQLLLEVEFVVEQGAEREQQWEEEGLEVEVVLGEDIFHEVEVGRQEEEETEELLVEEKQVHDVLQTEDNERQSHHEESMQGQLLTGEQFVLEGENCMQEGQVLEDAEDESQAEAGEESVKQELEVPGPIGPFTWSPLEALKELQLEMEPVNEQASRAFSQLKYRAWQRQKPHLELRSTIIQRIHGFWAKAFINHPELSAMISDQDENMLSFMIDLKVEKSNDSCRIVLLFCSNPYFRNDVIVKEYLVTLTGSRASYSTPIQWHEHYEQEAYSRRHHNSSLNFFNWFSDHSMAGSGRIVEYICNDLWPNPLKYYLMKVAAGKGVEKRTAIFDIPLSPRYPSPPLNTGHYEDVLEAYNFIKDFIVVRVDVIVPLCVVWWEFLEATTHNTKGPLHLKEYFIDKVFSENLGFQANIFLPLRK